MRMLRQTRKAYALLGQGLLIKLKTNLSGLVFVLVNSEELRCRFVTDINWGLSLGWIDTSLAPSDEVSETGEAVVNNSPVDC